MPHGAGCESGNCFSFWFDPAIVSTFNYSVLLMELPQGMFGISLAVPIVRLIFERGRFDADATQRVALSLACLAPSLLMFSMNNILAREFYALDDIKTPMKISLVCLVLNLVFAIWLVHPYRKAGLGVANTLSASLNLALLVCALRRKLSRVGLTSLVHTLLVLVPNAVLAGVVAAALAWLWDKQLGHATLRLKAGMVFLPGGVAGLVYRLIALWLKVPAAQEMTDLPCKGFGR